MARTENSFKLFLSIFNLENVHLHSNDAKLWFWKSSTLANTAARVKDNHRRLYSRILGEMCAVAMAMGLVKNKA